MNELELSFSKETTERFWAYLQSEIYLKEQNLTEHWGTRQQDNIEAFRVEGNNIFIRLNHSSGLFDQIDISQNFVTPKNKYKLVKTTCDSSERVHSFVISKLRSFRKILLRRLGCYNGIAYDPLYHFERLWGGGEITVEDIIAEYGGKIDSSTIVKGSHIFNEINEIIHLSGLNLTKIIEIGPGLGSCLRMIKKYKPETKFFLIDLPTSIPYSFTNLIKGLIDNNFNVERLKKDRIILNNLCYINADGEYIEGPDERVQDLMTVPSPYMTGLLDKFFDSPLVPVIETTRGCPYSCTFCNDGSILRNKVFRKNTDFVRDELEYIASRVKNTNQMFMVDLNFGMYKHDIETAKIIRSMIDRY